MDGNHVLVVFDDSSAGRRALEAAALVADERRADLSVVVLVDYDTRQIGCCVPAGYWNGVLTELASGDLGKARDLVGTRRASTSFEVASGNGMKGIEQASAKFGSDLVVVPRHGPLGRLSLHRLKRRIDAEVLGIPA